MRNTARIAQVRHWDGWMLDEWLVIRGGQTEATVRNERDAITLTGPESTEALEFIVALQKLNKEKV